MIHHLNPQDFHPFGTILSERQGRSKHPVKSMTTQELSLTREQAPVFYCEADCRIHPVAGSTILHLSQDGTDFSGFYLDKPVLIRAGITFSLSPVLGESNAQLCAHTLPRLLKHRRAEEDLRTLPKLRVESLYTLFYHEKEQGFVFPGEAHSMLELTYVDQGTLHSVADGRDLLLEQGDMVLYGPDQWHMQYADVDVAPRYMTISFDVAGQLPSDLLNRKLPASQKALSLLQQIQREQEHPDACSGDMQIALLNQLLIVLLRSADTSPEKLQTSYSVQNENEIIRRAQQYISSHVRHKLSVPLVAKQVDVSPSYLTALFHKHLQIAPGEYIRRIKLQESKQMIRENDMNFTQIAAALQYSTVHHFSRQFKEKFGITPSEYAKSVR